jgi:integrase
VGGAETLRLNGSRQASNFKTGTSRPGRDGRVRLPRTPASHHFSTNGGSRHGDQRQQAKGYRRGRPPIARRARRDTPVGLRDRAIILTLVLTGRRRAEVLGMKAGDVSFEGGTCFYTYRGKGGKTGRRELPRPALGAIQAWLRVAGKDLEALRPEESLWPDTKNGRGISSGTFYANLRKYMRKAGLPLAGVHIFRHSAAKLRRDAGESIEDVSRFLDHSSLAVTTTYLRRLEGEEDRAWAKVAEAIGV